MQDRSGAGPGHPLGTGYVRSASGRPFRGASRGVHAKIRWRIEHDYRELNHGLGLDHFEGRSWNGRHHRVTLVTAAHAGLTLYQTLDALQDLLNCWTDTRTTYRRPLPRTSTTSQDPRSRTT